MQKTYYLIQTENGDWAISQWFDLKYTTSENILDATKFTDKAYAEAFAQKCSGTIKPYTITSEYQRKQGDVGYTIYAVKLGGKLWLATKHYRLYPSTTYTFEDAVIFLDYKDASKNANKCHGSVMELSLLPGKGEDAITNAHQLPENTNPDNNMELLKKENELLKREAELNKREAELAKKELQMQQMQQKENQSKEN